MENLHLRGDSRSLSGYLRSFFPPSFTLFSLKATSFVFIFSIPFVGFSLYHSSNLHSYISGFRLPSNI